VLLDASASPQKTLKQPDAADDAADAAADAEALNLSPQRLHWQKNLAFQMGFGKLLASIGSVAGVLKRLHLLMISLHRRTCRECRLLFSLFCHHHVC